jgi:catechol 2,3-dioxygenase-like lactoylglutathione lyase family enzyme
MTDPNIVLLYVADAPRSAAFYADLLGKPAVESSPNFAMFALESGALLGLWSRADVEPAATAPSGAGELGFAVDSEDAVRARHADWSAMDFGFTFTAADPDGHRLRVFKPV